MPTVFVFITLATLLAVILALIVLLPWLRHDKTAQSNQLIELNVDVFGQRIDELKGDYEQGRLSESSFQTQKTELERQLLLASNDKGVVTRVTDNNDVNSAAINKQSTFARSYKARLIIFIWIPLMMGMGYVMAGDRSETLKLWQSQEKVGQVADDLLTGKIEVPPEWATKDSVGLLSAIQTNVYAHAHDAERWVRLADVYLALEANSQAMEALARAYRLQPDDDAIGVRFAQAQFFTSGGVLNAASRDALMKVLSHNPDHQGAQMLMAMGDARDGHYDNALTWVDRLQAGIASRDGNHSQALASLEELRQNIVGQRDGTMQAQSSNAANGSGTMPNSSNNAQGQSSASIRVNVAVSINPSLLPLIEPNDLLFVSISNKAGGPPVAVQRISASNVLEQLNIKSQVAPNAAGRSMAESTRFMVNLSDNNAMLPTHTLSSAIANNSELVVNARISKSGQAITQAGDLAAVAVPLSYNKQDPQELTVNMEINKQVP